MKYWKQISAILISVIFLYLTLDKIEFSKVAENISRFNPWYFLAAFFTIVLQYFVRAIRWKIILRPVRDVKAHSLFNINAIGFMGNAILPARLGEVVRVVLLSKRENVAYSKSIASLIVERVFDGIGLFSILIISMFVISYKTLRIGEYVTAFFLIFLGILVFLLGVYFFHKFIHKIVMKMPVKDKLKYAVIEELEKFVEGMHIIRSFKGVVEILFWSVILWLIITLFYYILILSFSFSVPFNAIRAGLLMTVITAIGVSVPSGPGYVGTFHYAVMLSLTAIAATLGKTELAVFAIVIHLIFVVSAVLVGVFGLFDYGVSFSQISRIKDEKPQD